MLLSSQLLGVNGVDESLECGIGCGGVWPLRHRDGHDVLGRWCLSSRRNRELRDSRGWRPHFAGEHCLREKSANGARQVSSAGGVGCNVFHAGH
jgi:hypothetical protein